MYKELHITYSDPDFKLDPIVLRYQIHNTNIAQKWANKLHECINNYDVDDPKRFYGFSDYDVEKKKAITSINQCIKIINNYKNNFVDKIVTDPIDQDTLNYLHHIFEVYHGMLNKPHDFFINAPKEVQKALAQLNIEVHRCELFVNDNGRKLAPRHIITYFSMPRNELLADEDYIHFTDFFEFGSIYLLYTEIGKTLEDLSKDDDHYISDEAYKPFRYFTADFVVSFFTTSNKFRNKNRIQMKKYYDKHKEFFDKRDLPLHHPYNRPGSIPLASLLPTHINIIDDLCKRQMVSKVSLL